MIKPVVRLDLPYPPSINHYYGRNRSGGVRIKAAGRAYRFQVIILVKQLLKDHETLTGNLFVSILMYPPDKRRRDIDNVLKALLDALQHAKVYKDDSQIHQLNIAKESPVKNGAIEVIVSTTDWKDEASSATIKGQHKILKDMEDTVNV